jgi:ATP-dependent DNA helicase RecQ
VLPFEGHAVLAGDLAFHHRPPPLRPASTRRAREDEVAAALSGDQAQLLAELKALRLSLAKARQVPAYVIFSDKTLLDIMRQHPRNLHEFAMVNGVGSTKLKDFGAQFLAVLTGDRASSAA